MGIIEILTGLCASAFLAGGVLAFAGLGETVSQRAGVFNLGIEGFMAMGGICAIATVAATGSLLLGTLAAAAVGLLMGALFALTTVLWRVNQVVAGLGFSFLGTGIAAWAGTAYAGKPAAVAYAKAPIPYLQDIPVLGEILFNHQAPIYFAFFVLPVALHFFLFRTRLGLSVLAVGENPAAADATGIPVLPIRFACVAFGSTLAAIAGAYLTLVFVPSWSDGITAGRGWIAIALVIFAGYRPLRLAAAAFFFGLITAFGFSAQSWGWSVPSALLSALPYLATLIIMLIPAFVATRGFVKSRPAALGQPYHKEER